MQCTHAHTCVCIQLLPGWRKNVLGPCLSSLQPRRGLPSSPRGLSTTQYWCCDNTVNCTSLTTSCRGRGRKNTKRDNDLNAHETLILNKSLVDMGKLILPSLPLLSFPPSPPLPQWHQVYKTQYHHTWLATPPQSSCLYQTDQWNYN